MIVSDAGGGRLALVRQIDHQDHCSALACAWGNSRFARPAPWGALAAATAWHDEGWREWDAHPTVAATGRPEDFPDIDRCGHVALYRRGIDLVCRRDPRAGLLVSLHGAGLYLRRQGLDRRPLLPTGPRPDAVERFLAEEAARQAALRVRLDLGVAEGDRPWEWACYRLLQAWDLLSLALTWGRIAQRPITLPRVPRNGSDRAGIDLTLTPAGPHRRICDPWPFASDRVVATVVVRHIADRAYADRADLAAALAAAPWERLSTEVVPAEVVGGRD